MGTWQRWQCPKCGTRWEAPLGHEPNVCPQCSLAKGPLPPASDARSFQDFVYGQAAEETAVTVGPRSRSGVASKRQQSRVPIAALVTCISCVLAIAGLIIWQMSGRGFESKAGKAPARLTQDR